MKTKSSQQAEAPASPLIERVLRFIAFSVEAPATAAVRLASAMTLIAFLIHTKANLLGASATGTSFALLYAATAWAIALYLRAQDRDRKDDA